MAIPVPTVPEIGYRGGVLYVEDVALPAVASAVGTPVYVYSSAVMERQYRRFDDAIRPLGGRICYAIKANSNQAVIATFARLGAGADVVSQGEIRRALAAAIPPERIVFSGVAKTEEELAFALDSGVGQINIESEPELETLSRLAAGRGRRAAIAIRVNPDIDAGTHPKIATGRAADKFGIGIGRAAALYRRALDLPGISPAGLAVHIGSQLLDLAPFEAAFARIAGLVGELRAENIPIRHLDLGGGIGVPARGEEKPDLDAYAATVRRTVGGLGCTLTFEPGRLLVAEAGVLVTRVIVVKQGATRRTVIQDGAMNDLIRPTLYEAYHPILPVAEAAEEEALAESDVVGPVCESGDYLAVARALPRVEAGDLLAVLCAGAYGAVMSSTYNSRLLVPEVLIRGDQWAAVRPRPAWETLIGADHLSPWLAE